MDEQASLARNTVYSAASAASNVLLIVLVVVAARLLRDTAFGEFSFALALASVFEMLTDLGLNTLTARDVARDRGLAGHYLPRILSWKLILASASMVLLVISVNALNQSRDARLAAYILGLGVVLRSYKAVSHAFFQAHERFDLILVTTYVERVLVLGFGIAALVIFKSLIPFVLVFVLARIPDVAFSYWLVHSHITRVRVAFDLRASRSLQAAALPLGAYAMIAVLYAYLSTVILGALRSTEEVGWYSTAYKVYEGLTMFPYLLMAVLLPRLSRLYLADRMRQTELIVRALKYLSAMSLPVAVCGGVLAPWIITGVFGAGYVEAVPVLRILLTAAVLMFANWALNTTLISADGQSKVLKVASAGLAINVIGNLALVPAFGMHGTAAALIISEACILVMLMLTARRLLDLRATPIAWKPALSTGTSALVVFGAGIRGPLYVVGAFVLLYTVMLLALRAFDRKDVSALRSLVSPPPQAGREF